MQFCINWNDLRYFLAIHRSGSLSAAARALGVNQSTVSRRLAAAEAALGSQLFERAGSALLPTDAGQSVLEYAERVEREVLSLEEHIAGTDQRPQGVVRITSVPTLINRLLIPHLPALLQCCPGLRIEAIAEVRSIRLTQRETDIALRLLRPQAGSAICRRIGTISYAVYAAKGKHATNLPWITYEEGYAHLPQARWVARRRAGGKDIPVTVSDGDSLLEAVQSGIGRGVLPTFVADEVPGLVRLSPGPPILQRDVWLVVHPDLRKTARVSAVLDWLDDVMQTVASS
jgi:DNA-binding transcriptional LysR family regulator